MKPHDKDIRSSVAAPGDYDAPWDIKPRSMVEREVIAAKEAAASAGGCHPTPLGTPRTSVVPQTLSSSASSSSAAAAASGCPQQYDEPWDQKQKQLIGKVAGS